MRRRGQFIQTGANYGPSGDAKTAAAAAPANPNSAEVPEEWRKHAREPWRIIFPDLDWKPPEVD